MPEPNIEDEPRFLEAIELMNAHEYLEASDLFEDLFFEAVRDEVGFVRVFLQVSAGAHHIERGQRRPAVERLEVALQAIDSVQRDRGYDLSGLRQDVEQLIRFVSTGGDINKGPIPWPEVRRR